MKLKYSDDRKVFNIHTDGIPCLSFDMFDRLGVPNLFTTRYISYDEERKAELLAAYGRDVKSFFFPVSPCTLIVIILLLVKTTPSRMPLKVWMICSLGVNIGVIISAKSLSLTGFSLKKDAFLKSIIF